MCNNIFELVWYRGVGYKIKVYYRLGSKRKMEILLTASFMTNVSSECHNSQVVYKQQNFLVDRAARSIVLYPPVLIITPGLYNCVTSRLNSL